MQRFRQTANVVVRLDRMGFFCFRRRALDHVRINCALCQPFCRRQLCGFALKNFHKNATDNFAFLFRVGYALELAEKFFSGIDMNDFHLHVLAKHFHHLSALMEPEQTGIDKHTRKLVADCALNECCGNARIDAAAEAQDYFLIADLFADIGDCLRYILRHIPVRLATADIMNKPVVDRAALRRVGNFGMKLDGIKAARFVGHRGQRRRFVRRDDGKARWQLCDFVAV